MRIALATDADVWTYDIARAALSQLTNHPALDRQPLWTPDGQRIIFTSMRAGYPELFWRLADGSGTDVRLLDRGKELLNLPPTVGRQTINTFWLPRRRRAVTR